MLEPVKIDNRWIGEGYPCFVIAEAGSNHNQDLSLAKRMIDAAVDAKADAIKFQSFKAELLVTRTMGKAEYQKEGPGDDATYFELLKRLEITEQDHLELKRHCEDSGIIFLSTPHSGKDSVDMLEELGVGAYKIGAGDLTNLPFLKYVARTHKPIILSTGMADLDMVQEAHEAITGEGNSQLIFLHCTTSYPCELEDVNLKAMASIRERFQVLTGYSDHTLSVDVPVGAVALGAVALEKHFTLDRNMEGPDHKASLEPDEIKLMVEKIRNIESALGDGNKRILDCEKGILEIARKSLIAGRRIEEGEVLTEANLIIKRPGTGIGPKYLDQFLGNKAVRVLEEDTLITWNDIAS